MICDGCPHYRGTRGDMVRCWNKKLMLLTEIPMESLRRRRVCPSRVEVSVPSPLPSSGSVDWRTRISMEVKKK